MNRLLRSRVLGFFVGALAVPALAAAQAQQRDLFVSVVDKAGAPVKDLQVADFVVREDNLAREVLAVRPFTEPLDLVLLIDNSTAVQRDVSLLRSALTSFVRSLGDDHRYALVTFGERPTLVVDNVTRVDELASKGINRLFSLPDTGSYLLDALVEVNRGFAKREASHPVIVVVSFEGPELSNTHYSNVLDSLRETGAGLFVVAVNIPNTADLNSIERQSREMVYSRGTREAGGRLQTALSAQGLEFELKQLAAALKERYVVTYARPETLIPPKKVEVTAKRSGLDVRGLPAKAGASR